MSVSFVVCALSTVRRVTELWSMPFECVATYRYSNAYILILSYTVGGLSFVFYSKGT